MRYDYDYDIWPLFYDQYYADLHQAEYPFYARELTGCAGPVLELGCGTGTFLFRLLDDGFDAYGLDVAAPMLAELFRRAEAQGRADVARRVTQQSMVSFSCAQRFAAVLIPARAFLHLSTAEEQIATLRSVHAHLEPGGRLLLNFFAPEPRWFSEHKADKPPEPFERYRHPDTGEPVELWIQRTVDDLTSQLIHVEWLFKLGEVTRTTRMTLRWIYRAEFELLLRLAGFARWEVFGDFDRSAFDDRAGEMIWIAHKAG